MTDKTLNQHIADAIASLKAANDMRRDWNANAKRNGYAAAFRNPPEIAGHLHTELLEEMVYYDDDAAGSLHEIRRENGVDDDGEPIEVEPAIIGRVRMSDVEFDYKAAIGAL